MKRILLAISLIGLIGCHKPSTEYTTLEVSVTDVTTGLPLDNIEFKISNESWVGGNTITEGFTKHGHTPLSFDAHRGSNYYVFIKNLDEDYVIMNHWDYHIRKGQVNKKELHLAKNGTLHIGLQNTAYFSSYDEVSFKISPLNSDFNDVQVINIGYDWGYGVSGVGNVPDYAYYDLPATEYLIEWRGDRTNNNVTYGEETVTIYPDSTVYYNIQF
jgi:hypothetical protein